MGLRSIGRKLTPSTRFKLRLPEKKALPFYQSPEWRALMNEIIGERGRYCEDPAHDAGTPRFGGRVYGDHVIELRDGGAPFDKGNVMLRCHTCHQRKTIAERTKRRGVGGSNL